MTDAQENLKLIPQPITEEMGVHADWYEEAKGPEMSLKTLPTFLEKLSTRYKHDYGTICHAIAAGALAAARAMDRTDQGGITGFQAGAIMWQFIRHWGLSTDGPLAMIRYNDMLYPQYEKRFDRTISKDVWEDLQATAKKYLVDSPDAHPDIITHWQSVVDGKIPFGYTVKEDE